MFLEIKVDEGLIHYPADTHFLSLNEASLELTELKTKLRKNY